MKIAIYARKSKMSEKGESIDNQISTCKDYMMRWSTAASEDIEFMIYQDEGFSGGNTDRPEFQNMLNDAKNNAFSMLICYRLDRVSRNIADFSNTYNLLQEHGIEFVSVKEQFDTSTPIGRAMLNIAMVFAQLERETIAERIRDNMLALARTGRWLGGITPTGFLSTPIEYYDDRMNHKKMFTLTPDQDEMEKVKLIFDKFLEIKSLRGVESYLLMNDIRTKNDCKYTADTIKDILTNPVYVAADQSMFTYLSEDMGCDICNQINEFNGKHAMMIYNKTEKIGKKMVAKDPTLWIAAIGKHKPIISGTKWVLIQKILSNNTDKSFFKDSDAQYGLLSGLIKCAHCGSTMKLKKGKESKITGKTAFTYVCYTKEMTKRTKCNVPNVIGQEVDQDVLDYLLSLAASDSFINQKLHSDQFAMKETILSGSKQIGDLQLQLNETNSSIHNLMEQLAQVDVSLSHHFMDKLKELDEQKKSIEDKIKKMKDHAAFTQTNILNLELMQNALTALGALSETDDIKIRRSLIRSVIEKITWDGENLDIHIFGQEVCPPYDFLQG